MGYRKYNPKKVYQACKTWVRLEGGTLAEVWERATRNPDAQVFRKYLLFTHELEGDQ